MIMLLTVWSATNNIKLSEGINHLTLRHENSYDPHKENELVGGSLVCRDTKKDHQTSQPITHTKLKTTKCVVTLCRNFLTENFSHGKTN